MLCPDLLSIIRFCILSDEQTLTCWDVLTAKNWCCPSAPQTYPNARLSVTSWAMNEILFTRCSCSITLKRYRKRWHGAHYKVNTEFYDKWSGQFLISQINLQMYTQLLTPVFSSTIFIPVREMFTHILCLCFPWERAAIAMPCIQTRTEQFPHNNCTINNKINHSSRHIFPIIKRVKTCIPPTLV